LRQTFCAFAANGRVLQRERAENLTHLGFSAVDQRQARPAASSLPAFTWHGLHIRLPAVQIFAESWPVAVLHVGNPAKICPRATHFSPRPAKPDRPQGGGRLQPPAQSDCGVVWCAAPGIRRYRPAHCGSCTPSALPLAAVSTDARGSGAQARTMGRALTAN